jgi:HlyD family secretion protein
MTPNENSAMHAPNNLPFALKPLTLALAIASMLALGGLGLWAIASPGADTSITTDTTATATTTATTESSTPAAGTKPSLTVSVIHATTATAPISLLANGNVAAWQEASVGAETAGLRVLELKAQVGDTVQRGQVLATFAADGVQADVALSRAALSEASANAADASANAERARAVQTTGALSAQQIQQYLTGELTAKARVESAKAQLDAQLLRLKHTQLLAPDSGTITQRNGTVGAVVGAGTELFRLIRQGRLEWRGEVTSSELGRIRTGMAVALTAPSGAQAQGRVRMVSPTVDPASRNGLVYVDLLSTKGANASLAAFKPGMFARGEIALGQSEALTVPQTAVVVRDGFSYVYRVGPDQRVSALKVQTGRTLGTQVEILKGISPKDQLVASGGGFLSDGDLVRVVDAKNTANKPVALAKPAQAATK